MSKIYRFSHKSAARVKNHDKSRQMPKFMSTAKIHGIREFVI